MKLKTLLTTLAAAVGLTTAAQAGTSTPLLLLNYYTDTQASGWVNYTQTGGAGIAKQTSNGVSFTVNCGGGNFKNSFMKASPDSFSDGTYTDIYGVSHTSLLDEIKTSLNISTAIGAEIYNSGLAQGARSDATGVVEGLDPEKQYVVYFGFGLTHQGNSSYEPGFTLSNGGYGTLKSLEYVVTRGASGFGTVAATKWTSFNAGTNIRPADTALMIVRYIGTPNSSGKINIALLGERSSMNFMAVAQMPEAEVTTYAATISEDSNWTALDWDPDWPEGGADGANANLTVGATSTLTINENETMNKLVVTGDAGKDLTIAKGDGVTTTVATYDFSGASGKTTVNYGTGTAAVKAGTDTVLAETGTGALTIGTNLKATVPGWSGSNLSGAGTIVYNAASASTAVAPGAFSSGFTGNIKLTKGTWTCTGDYPQSRPVTLSGADATFVLQKQDGMGYGSGLPTFTVENGATFKVEARDTFNRTLALKNGGKLVCKQDNINSGRSFDFYSASALTVEGDAPCTIGGLTDGSTEASGILAIRRSDFTVTVAEGGELQCYSKWSTADSPSGNFIKAGAGKFTQYRDSSIALPFAVNGGTLKYVNGGRTTTAGITLGDGCKLELSATGDGSYTLSNVISGKGRIEKQDAGTYTLSGANTYTGGTTVSGGKLIVTTVNGSYAVGSGAAFDYAQDISASGEFTKPTFTAADGAITLTVTLSKADVLGSRKVAMATLGDGVSADNITVKVVNADSGNEVDVIKSVEDSIVYVTPDAAARDLVYKPTEAGDLTWNVGTQFGDKQFRDYDNVSFQTADGGAVEVDVDAPANVAAGNIEVGATYTFTGKPIIAGDVKTLANADATFENELVADSVVVTDGSTFKAAEIVASEVAVTNSTFESAVVGPSMKYVRLTITATDGCISGDKIPAVSEFRLYRGSATTGYTILDWPEGTKISDCTGATVTKTTSVYPGPVGTSNEKQPGCLIDGYFGNSYETSGYGSGAIRLNKWWPTSVSTGPWTVTVEFPYPVATFSGCNFCLADYQSRNPTAWTIEVSSDGENWTEVNNTTGAEWSGQYAWAGGDENTPAFLNKGTTPTAVKVGDKSTIVADGAWTAALEVGGAVTFKGIAGKYLTLDAASTSQFDEGATLKFDLTEYDVSKAGKQYVIAGPTEGWPAVDKITVVPEGIYELGVDEEGYYVIGQSGTYWLGESEGVGTWDFKNTKVWGVEATSENGTIWLNGAAAKFTRNGTVMVVDGVEPTAINILSNDVSVTFKGYIDALATVPFAINATNDTLTIENAEAYTLPTITAVADANFTLKKAGAGVLAVNNTNPFGGGSAVVEAGTLDLNGKCINATYTLKAGTTLADLSSTDIGNGLAQTRAITLDGNATVDATGQFGLVGSQYAATTLTLNGNTLTKTGTNSFWLCNTTVDAGTIDVQAGTIDTINANQGNTTIAGTLNLAAGTEFAGRGFPEIGTVTGTGTLSGAAKITTKLMGTVNTTATITFADNATFDATGCTYEEDQKVLTWSAKPTNLTVVYDGAFTLEQRDDGLYAVDMAKRGDHTWTPAAETGTWSSTGFNGDNNYRDPSASAKFVDGDGIGAATVTIDGTRTVTSFVIDNADTAYILEGGNFVSTTFEKKGPGTATLKVGGDTRPGAATITAGTLVIGTDADNNSYKFQADSIVVKSGAVLDLRSRDAAYKAATMTVEAGGKITSAAFNALNAVTLSGGTIESAGGWNATWGPWCLEGSLTATGNTTSYITTAENPAANYGLQLATGIFNVEEGSTLEVSTPLKNGPGDRGSLTNQVRKTGAGTMVIKTTPTYSGISDIQAGTYVLDCGNVSGTYQVAADATFEMGTNRNLTVSGAGAVKVVLTDADMTVEGPIVAFTVPSEAATPTVTVLNEKGEDIGDKCTVTGGSIQVNHAAKIGSTYYLTLAEALSEAEEGDTVTLLANATVTVAGAMPAGATIAFNGFTLTVDSTGLVDFTTAILTDASVVLKNGYPLFSKIQSVTVADDAEVAKDASVCVLLSLDDYFGSVAVTSSVTYGGEHGTIGCYYNQSLHLATATIKDGKIVHAAPTLLTWAGTQDVTDWYDAKAWARKVGDDTYYSQWQDGTTAAVEFKGTSIVTITNDVAPSAITLPTAASSRVDITGHSHLPANVAFNVPANVWLYLHENAEKQFGGTITGTGYFCIDIDGESNVTDMIPPEAFSNFSGKFYITSGSYKVSKNTGVVSTLPRDNGQLYIVDNAEWSQSVTLMGEGAEIGETGVTAQLRIGKNVTFGAISVGFNPTGVTNPSIWVDEDAVADLTKGGFSATNGGLAKVGPGTLILRKDNYGEASVTGTLAVNGGTLQYGNGTSTTVARDWPTTITVANGATLKFNVVDPSCQTASVAQPISSAITVANGGKVALNGTKFSFDSLTLNGADSVLDTYLSRGVTVAGAGKVDVTLTDAELANKGGTVAVFTTTGTTTFGKITDKDGNDVSGKCKVSGGTLRIVVPTMLFMK